MANILGTNFSYTYDGNLSEEILVTQAVQNPDIRDLFRVIDGIDHKEQLSLLSPGGKALKGAQACGAQSTTGAIENIYNREIEVTKVQMELIQCVDVFENTIIGKLKNLDVDVNDLSGTVLGNVLESYASEMLMRELFRVWCFGDISNGPNDYYNMLDGLWARLFAGVSSYDVNAVNASISALGAPTSTGSDRAVDYFRALVDGSDTELKQLVMDGAVLYVTGNVYENYIWFLESQGNLESSFTALQSGRRAASYRGIPVAPLYAWDKWIAADGLGNNTRILLTLPPNHVAGFGAASRVDALEVWYEKKEKEYHIRSEFRTGYNYVEPKLQAISYGNI